MFKCFVFVSALVLSASAFPAETQTGGLFGGMKNIFSSQFQAGKMVSDLITDGIKTGTNLGKGATQIAGDLAKTSTNAGIALGMHAVQKGSQLASNAADIPATIVQDIPIVGGIVDAGTDVAKMGIAVGMNTAMMGMQGAQKAVHTGVNTATGIANMGLSAVESAASFGNGLAKGVLGMFQ